MRACNQEGQGHHHATGRKRFWLGKGTVMIGGTTLFLTCGIMGSQKIVSIHGSTCSADVGDTEKFDTSINVNLAKTGDSMTICSKVIEQ